jgi:hypothetical protein
MWAINRMIATVILAALTLLPISAALAVTSNDVNKQMRDAQNLYFKGKVQEADDALKKAEEMASEIMAGPNAAEKEKVKRLDGRLKKLRKDIDAKLGKPEGKETPTKAEGKSPETKPASTAEASGELPSHVTSDLKVVERYIDGARQNLDSGDVRNARRSIGSAQDKLQQTAERKKRYITPEHPEYKALLARIEEVDAAVSAAEKGQAEQKAAADKAAENAKAESDKWVARLKPYVTGLGQQGYDPERYFVASYTADQQEMAKRTVIFGKVAADMEAYRAAGLGDNATDELKLIIRDIEHALKTFEESTKSMAELKLKEAGRQIDYIITWLNKEAKKIGSKEMPLTMNRMTFESARRDLDGAGSLLGEDEARVKALEAKYREALSLDAKIAKARVAQTRMIPDKFGGPELSVLKKKAEEVLGEVKSGVKILRTTVISPDWKEESVIEWTDTTRSALRHRVTRSVSAQVAGKSGDETTLYTLHIAKDRRTDGSWSQLRGHIMFEDPILEENVGK